MRQLRFGVAGLKDTKDLKGSIEFCVDNGYSACEVQFVKEFTLDEAECAELGSIARDQGVALSVHAPYFAQLTTKEPDRIKQHLGALHHSCKLGSQLGATVIVCHPGSRGEASAEELVERVDANLRALGPRVGDLAVKLGLETCGRRSQFGSLGDIALLVREHAFTTPVIDYGHIHALSNGSLRDKAAFDALFSYIIQEFSSEHLWPLHTHFSDNQFGDAGELRHIPYGTGTLKIGNVLDGARPHDLALTVISEHKDPASHAAVRDELKSKKAPLIPPMPRATSLRGKQGSWLPHAIPLEERGEAHYFQRGSRELRVTNVSKMYFPDDEITKGDLIGYYYNAAPLMLPFLRDRPITMHRVPEGIYGEAFYEKQIPRGAPGWVKTVEVPSDGGRKKIDFVIVDDVMTLVWLAQIASVECHAWTSRTPKLDEPDFAVMDLDPHEPIGFADVRAVASLVNVVLTKLGIRGFPKTSGGSGIQVFIPLAPGHTYPEVREFCGAVGSLLRSAYPEKVTMEASKAKRAGKVYVDVDQNAKGQTLVAPYSVRPYPGAPVSAPLEWTELEQDLVPEQFTIRTIFERLEEVGDPFKPALSLKQDLHPALEQLR